VALNLVCLQQHAAYSQSTRDVVGTPLKRTFAVITITALSAVRAPAIKWEFGTALYS